LTGNIAIYDTPHDHLGFVVPKRYVDGMITITELDHRVSELEHLVHNKLTSKVDSMNWAIGQTYASTEAMRVDIAGLHVGLADLEAKQAANTAALKAAINLRASELEHRLGETAASLRHDTTRLRESTQRGFEAVNTRFDAVNDRFDGVDQRLDRIDQRFDGVDQRFDELLAAIQEGKGDNPPGQKK
jgi:chromosome segregation ATPase